MLPKGLCSEIFTFAVGVLVVVLIIVIVIIIIIIIIIINFNNITFVERHSAIASEAGYLCRSQYNVLNILVKSAASVPITNLLIVGDALEITSVTATGTDVSQRCFDSS